MCQMILNSEFNGVELYFEDKPESAIIAALKEVGYRWHKFKKCWYAKQNDKTIKTANELSTGEAVTSENEKVEDKSYYPTYESVGSTKIYKSSDVDLFDNKSGYFADEIVYAHFYSDSAVIIDLTNALQVGKTCTRYAVNHIDWSKRESIALPLYNDNKIKTFKDLIQAIKSDKELINIQVQKSDIKSIETFSPFVKIKPIKTPAKWTKAHLWKAILSGQVYKGVTDGYYTDDYAGDAACNYMKGCSVDLIDFADDLIKSSSSGIRIYGRGLDNGCVLISYHNHSFDTKSFYYNEKCNHDEKEKLITKEIDELKQYNDDLLTKVLDIQSSDIQNNSIYNISYLEMDSNTGKYEIKNKLTYSSNIFFEEDYYDEKPECNYKIIKIERFNPDNKTLYAISNFHNRPYGDAYDDKRIINMGNWENVVTGYALKELSEEGKTFATIRVSQTSTIERAKEICEKHNNGTMSWGVSVCNTDYSKSLYKLNSEELRIPEDTEICLIYQ